MIASNRGVRRGSSLSDYALGLDFGTGSVRASIVDCADGSVAATAVRGYPHGVDGVVVDPRRPELARQHPGDYATAAAAAIRAALAQAERAHRVQPAQIAGIGVDATASTPIPLDVRCRPLALDERFEGDLAAHAWLWKDHTAHAEAAEITAAAQRDRPEYLRRCGGTYSSEWFWSKVLRCAREAPAVFEAAHTWVELADHVPAWLCGIEDPAAIPRNVCAAGHKAMWAAEWGGYPDVDFLAALDPRLATLRSRLPDDALPADRIAGRVADAIARLTGLAAGTPVAVGAIDAHLGAVGAGVREGDVVKVLGTSTCDMAVMPGTRLPDVPGLCGVVPGSIVPELIGLEAGQSAVGDVYAWCARNVGHRPLEALEQDAAAIRPGASGLLALDWLNGNRCVLVDPALTGAIVGLNLQSTDAEIYRALVEATAFGARVIVDRMVEAGVKVERVIACGGIARKSPLVVQIHADVLGREVAVAAADQTCALGAAIVGAVAAGRHADTRAAQRAMCREPSRRYTPDPDAHAVYARLHRLYVDLHDAFGVAGDRRGLAHVMKELLAIRREVR